MTYKSLLAATIGLALTQYAYGTQSVSSIAAAAALHAESRHWLRALAVSLSTSDRSTRELV